MTRLNYILPIVALTAGLACSTGPGDGHIPREREPNQHTVHVPGGTKMTFSVPILEDVGPDAGLTDRGAAPAADSGTVPAVDPGVSCDIPGVDSASIYEACRKTEPQP